MIRDPFWREALGPFLHYHRGSWRKLRNAAAGSKLEKEEDRLDKDREIYSSIKSALFRLILFFGDLNSDIHPRSLLCSVDILDWALGIFVFNDATFEIDHPIRAFLLGLSTSTPEKLQRQVNTIMQPLLRVINEKNPSGDLAGHGEALYPLHSCLNHSCKPNVKQIPGSVDGRIILQTLKDVHPGDILTVSYIEGKKPKPDRQTQLRTSFGFDCRCRLCQSEGVPTCSSSSSPILATPLPSLSESSSISN